MKAVSVAPMPQEFALAHAGRLAFFNCGPMGRWHRVEQISAFAESIRAGAGAQPMLGQLATISGMPLTEYARQHSLLPALRVADRGHTPELHGGSENPNVVRKIGTRLHTDRVQLCCQCVKDDLSHWSFSWFRRTHNIAGIEMCPVHGTPLHWVTGDDPLSCLPQHWVETDEIERVKFDPTSEVECRFQLRLHAIYEIFLERDRPFALPEIHPALIARTNELDLSSSPRSSKPTISDYALEHAPRAWLQRHWPDICTKEKGKFLLALDRLNGAGITPGTGFAYATAFAILFDAAEDASHYLRRTSTQLHKQPKQPKQPARQKYPQAFWHNEFVDIFFQLGGSISATAKHLGLDTRTVNKKIRSLSSTKACGFSSRWLALQRFGAGESLVDACAAEGVDVKLIENLLRMASTSLLRVGELKKTHKRGALQGNAAVASAHKT